MPGATQFFWPRLRRGGLRREFFRQDEDRAVIWPAGYGRRVLAEVDSTNAEGLRRAAAAVAGGPEWILALRQTGGRGRRGRAWSDPPGNFAATLVLPLVGGVGDAALYSFVAALALGDACVEVTGQPGLFALKWPNDVLLQGGKMAGILLESTVLAPGRLVLAIGIGVNLLHAPVPESLEPGSVAPVSLKAGAGVEIAPEAFLDPLARGFAHWQRVLERDGFAPVRSAWLDRAARLGEEITARTMRDSVTGRFAGIDAGGQLVLDTAGGRVLVPAADIYFGRG